MLTIIIRSIIIYLVVLFVFRIMGKRQLGQMQPFELVLTLIIADLATIPMAEISVPVLHGIIPLFTLVLLHFLLTILSKISSRFGYFISGKPVIIINPKGIDCKALKALNLSIDDLFEAMRGVGYFSLDQIQYAIMETNGKVSILPKSKFSPVTNGDINNKADETSLPVNLISEGKILKDNLEIAKVDEKFVLDFLKNQANNNKLKDVLVMTIDKSGKVIIQMRKGESKVFENVRDSLWKYFQKWCWY